MDVDSDIKKFLSKNGKKGGERTRDLYGSEHFSEMGKKGKKK